MAHNTPSSTVMKVRQEAALFDSKDRLLLFSTKNDFQTPLLREASDTFYEKWKHSGNAIPLDSFIPVSASFTPQQKKQCETLFKTVFKEKAEARAQKHAEHIQELIDGDRQKLKRAYDAIKAELQSYENNIGFLTAASKKGNSLIDQTQKKIESLKKDLEQIAQKLKES